MTIANWEVSGKNLSRNNSDQLTNNAAHCLTKIPLTNQLFVQPLLIGANGSLIMTHLQMRNTNAPMNTQGLYKPPKLKNKIKSTRTKSPRCKLRQKSKQLLHRDTLKLKKKYIFTVTKSNLMLKKNN